MKPLRFCRPCRFARSAITVLLAFCLLSSYASSVFATPDEATLDYFDLIGIPYYDPTGAVGSNCNVTGANSGENTNYAGDQVWTDAELKAVEANRPFYEAAAEQYNFPWQILAVIHRIETSLRRYNPANGQGAYQHVSHPGYSWPAKDSLTDDEFREQTEYTAKTIKESYGAGLDLNNPDDIKRMFFRYNGTASKYKEKGIALGFTSEQADNGEGSPYVMNRYDAMRDPNSPDMSPSWPGMYANDGVYTEGYTVQWFGAFVYYTALGGTSGACNVTGNGDINAMAIQLAYPDHPHGCSPIKPEYEEAMKKYGTWDEYRGCSCDRFVATVMRASGADPNFEYAGTSAQIQYLESHPELYEEIDHQQNTANLQPGDIMIVPGHIMMYAVNSEGKGGIASASIGSRTGDFNAGTPNFVDSLGRGIYRVFRFKGNTTTSTDKEKTKE